MKKAKISTAYLLFTRKIMTQNPGQDKLNRRFSLPHCALTCM